VGVRLLRAWLVAVALAATVFGASPLPAPPGNYLLDEAEVLSPGQKLVLAQKLAQFERETSSQLWVCVLPEVPSDYAMEDFTQRTAEAWGVGRKEKDNGMVLFVFPQSRAMRIEVGYGLEGAVPDALANNIINDEIVPYFRGGDMAGGIERGAEALMAAARGEYTGTGQTLGEQQGPENDPAALFWALVILIIFIVIATKRAQSGRGSIYGPGGRRDLFLPSSGSSGGGFGGGSSFGGGGSLGGGGSFGGGGASGRW
jgi:uncharacterized protein